MGVREIDQTTHLGCISLLLNGAVDRRDGRGGGEQQRCLGQGRGGCLFMSFTHV